MKKKLLCLLLSAALLIPAMPVSAKAKPKMSKTSITITVGKTYKLKLKNNKKKVKWSSKSKNIATVTSKGIVKGKKKGTTYIYAKVGKKKYKCKAKIEQPSLSSSNVKVAIGKTYTLKLNGTSRKKTYSSNNKSVATVNSSGFISGKKTGTAKITVKISDKSYQCKVTVYDPVGSRTNPANPRNGVTVQTDYGTMYFKLNRTIKGTAAINQLKTMGEWTDYEEDEYNSRPNTTLVFFEYDVKAAKGYSSSPLEGLSIINSCDLYNGNCTQSISDIDASYLLNSHSNQDFVNLEIYSGVSSKMYMALYVPNGTSSFSNHIYAKDYTQYWVRYTF